VGREWRVIVCLVAWLVATSLMRAILADGAPGRDRWTEGLRTL